MVSEYDRRRRLVLNELGKIKCLSYTVPKGAFYMFPDFSNFDISDETFAVYLLKNAGVATAPGSGFGNAGKGHLRISYSVSYDQVKEGLRRIVETLERRT
jgi:aspartate/methionine/tyrosine aminotransferase